MIIKYLLKNLKPLLNKILEILKIEYKLFKMLVNLKISTC